MAYEPRDSAAHDPEVPSHSRPTFAPRALPAGDATSKYCPRVRRITTEAAASYLGRSVRTLEDWRQSWRPALAEGKPPLRKGPKFYKVGKRVLYDVRDLKTFNAARRARDRTPLGHRKPFVQISALRSIRGIPNWICEAAGTPAHPNDSGEKPVLNCLDHNPI